MRYGMRKLARDEEGEGGKRVGGYEAKKEVERTAVLGEIT